MTRKALARIAVLPLLASAVLVGTLALPMTAAHASTSLGSLTFAPAVGSDKSPITVTTHASGATKGCPSPSTNVSGTAIGPDKWAAGILVVGNTSSGVSTTSDFAVDFADTMYGIGRSNNAPVVTGRYDITLSCQNHLGNTVYGTFAGSLWFTDSTHFQSTDPAGVAPPTHTPTASPAGSPTASPSRSASPPAVGSPSPVMTALVSASASATASPLVTGSMSATPAVTPGPIVLDVLDDSGQSLAANPTLNPGEKVTVMTNGFGAGEHVGVTLHSTPVVLPAAQADAQGLVAYDFTVPKDLPEGQHTLTFKGASYTSAFGFQLAGATNASGTGGAATVAAAELPRTGAPNPRRLLALAVTLLLFGGLLVYLARRNSLLHRPRHAA